MKLLCQEAHVYQDSHFVAGEVYDLDDRAATRLLRDFGPMAEDDNRGGHPVKFTIAPPAAVSPETEPQAEPTQPEPATETAAVAKPKRQRAPAKPKETRPRGA